MDDLDDLGPASHSFVSQRLRLNYVDWGNHGAPIVILLHGGRDHARSWDWVARGLKDDWHVVAPDLRGHGDSAWSPDGAYITPYFVYDLAQLVHQISAAPVSIVAHSFGGAVALHYAGLFPERVRRLVAIEGLGLQSLDPNRPQGVRQVWRQWINERRDLSARRPRRYATIDEAYGRMRAENQQLTAEQARHLTVHGIDRNEDGTFSWKFDNYVRSFGPLQISDDDTRSLWGAIECPVWLVHGADSWAGHPEEHGRAACFRNARVTSFERAGHWPHHDRFDDFMRELKAFL